MNHIVAIQGVQTDFKGFRHLPDSDVWKCERCHQAWSGKTVPSLSFHYAVCDCESQPRAVVAAVGGDRHPWIRLLAERRVHFQGKYSSRFWCGVKVVESDDSTGEVLKVRLIPEHPRWGAVDYTREAFLSAFREGSFSF